MVDGVYLNKTGLGLNDSVDIERIEVLQGPQGTLYGKNSNAGVVNITTKIIKISKFNFSEVLFRIDYLPHALSNSICSETDIRWWVPGSGNIAL